MKTTISLILEDKNLENLEKVADKETRSRSNMLNRILEEYFERPKEAVKDEEI